MLVFCFTKEKNTFQVSVESTLLFSSFTLSFTRYFQNYKKDILF